MPKPDDDLLNTPLPESTQLPWRERTPDESAASLIRRIKGMLVGDEFTYAEATLRGILETVERTGRCTSRQVDAVDNIGRRSSHESYGTANWRRR